MFDGIKTLENFVIEPGSSGIRVPGTRFLLTAEGDPNSGGGDPSAAPPAAPAPSATPTWYAPAETLKTSDPDVWTSFEKGVQSGNHKDFPTFVKHAVGLEKRLGGAISLPGKDAKPEEVTAWSKDLGEKVKGHGLALVKAQDAPPESPDKYEINVDAIPEGLRSESTVKAVREWAHKNNVSNAAIGELMALEGKRYTEEIAPVLVADRQKAQAEFDTWAASTGKESKALQAYGGAWLTKNFTEAQMQHLESIKIPNGNGGFITAADDPVLLRLVAQAGMDTGEEISEISGTGDPPADAEFDEMLKMTTDPKHPDYQLWLHGSPEDPKRIALMAKRDAAFKKKYGTGEVR